MMRPETTRTTWTAWTTQLEQQQSDREREGETPGEPHTLCDERRCEAGRKT